MFLLSLPMRERGLKFTHVLVWKIDRIVAPHAGAWIEIVKAYNTQITASSRSPCGSVD